MPDTYELDPITVAYLRGGPLAVVRTVVFNLWKNNRIIFEKKEGSGKRGNEEISVLTPISDIRQPIEQRVVEALQGTNLKESLAQKISRRLINEVDQMVEPHKKILHDKGLLRSKAGRRRPLLITLAASALIILPGLAKIVLGIMNDKPVLILVIIVSLYLPVAFGLLVMSFKVRPVSRLGKAFLRHQAGVFREDLERVRGGMAPQSDATMLAALFGVAILGAAFMPISEAFARERFGGGCTLLSDAGCSSNGCTSGCSAGSCSSGCSSSSSSGCSSSGCSSSGCSSGCGGCGGGD